MANPHDPNPPTTTAPAWHWDSRHDFPRDVIGYGPGSHDPRWPGGAKIAVSFVVNYEEGAELTVLNGDAYSETRLWEAAGAPPRLRQRAVNVESEYDYGARAGVWRLLRLFERRGLSVTLYAVSKALEDNPEVGRECVRVGHDVACHGYRWVDYHDFSPEDEKAMIKRGIEAVKNVTGEYPKGWYYGRLSPRSHALVWDVFHEMGIPLLWNSDSYADDVPYWVDVPAEKDDPDPKGLLMVPYSYDCNDFKFGVATGFGAPMDFYDHVKSAFDMLYEEGCEGMPKMMTVGLHCRVAGKPARFAALKKFVEYISSKEGVWVATRTQIAEHFREQFPYRKGQRV